MGSRWEVRRRFYVLSHGNIRAGRLMVTMNWRSPQRQCSSQYSHKSATLARWIGASVRRTAIGAALTLWSFSAGSPADARSTAVGLGVRTCAQFAEEYRKDPKGFDDLYFQWAQGLLSGMNSGLSDLNRIELLPVGFGSEKQQAFIRLYCDQHPLSFYLQAVYALFARLSSQR
jgi:hypothetical protein